MVFQQVIGNQRGKAGFEIAEKEIGAFRREQVSHVVRVGLDVLQQVAEHRIRFAWGHVGVAGVVVIHDAVDDVVEKFVTHFFQQIIFGLEMGVERTAANIRPVDDVLNGDFGIGFFG